MDLTVFKSSGASKALKTSLNLLKQIYTMHHDENVLRETADTLAHLADPPGQDGYAGQREAKAVVHALVDTVSGAFVTAATEATAPGFGKGASSRGASKGASKGGKRASSKKQDDTEEEEEEEDKDGKKGFLEIIMFHRTVCYMKLFPVYTH